MLSIGWDDGILSVILWYTMNRMTVYCEPIDDIPSRKGWLMGEEIRIVQCVISAKVSWKIKLRSVSY